MSTQRARNWLIHICSTTLSILRPLSAASAHLNCVPRSLTKAWPSQAAVKRGTSATSRKRRYARECSSSLLLQAFG